MKYIKKLTALVLFLTLIVSVLPTMKREVKAAEKPVITLTLSTEEASTQPIKLKATATSNVGITEFKYTTGKHKKGYFTGEKYAARIKTITIKDSYITSRNFKIRKNATYTFYAKDVNGSAVVKTINITNMVAEERAVWVSYLEFTDKGYDEAPFDAHIDEMYDTIKADGFNTVYQIVRPFSDAFYPSRYYPWSKYVSGSEGTDPGFDPLAYMINAAKVRGLKFYAYINPYRVCKSADFKSIYDGAYSEYTGVLSGTAINPANPAYNWLNDDDTENDRNVLKMSGVYFYNPAVPEVRELIVNGVREILDNYDVDGIIFDDYFYPALGTKYKTTFDSEEYDNYVSECEENGIVPEFDNIADWRRNNVNLLVSEVYSTVKSYGNNIRFGISPAGNIDNLTSNSKYYVDIDRWCSEDGYIDFIAPQLYWGFDHEICPFEETVDRWINEITNPNVKLYITLPMHNAQAVPTAEWKENKDVLARMVASMRTKGKVTGFSVFRYNFLTDPYLKVDGATTERDNLLEEINK